MSIDTNKSKLKVILDTNILISAIGFGGKPRKILQLVLNKQIQAITSPVLMVEFQDIIFKKFPLLAEKCEKIQILIKRKTKLVNPKVSLHILKDEPDNRVLEAASTGQCQYIITGDRELLQLRNYKRIKILNADQFLQIFEK
ncbi:MAG: putative toxin-antitoxin system toxin component, PIN family [Patescibacteria group bacterium]